MEKLVLVHWESDDATYSHETVYPLLYKSLEEFNEDIEAEASLANFFGVKEFRFYGWKFCTHDILTKNLKIYRLEDWFNERLIIDPTIT